MSVDIMTWLPSRVDVDPGGCWNWIGYIHPSGYGQYKSKYSPELPQAAHRAVYVSLVGPVDPSLDLDHLCRNRRCVNPDHLEPVTRAENLRRSPLMTYWRARYQRGWAA